LEHQTRKKAISTAVEKGARHFPLYASKKLAPDNANGMVGMVGQTTWIVTALRTGKTTVTVTSLPPASQMTAVGASPETCEQVVGVLQITVMAKLVLVTPN